MDAHANFAYSLVSVAPSPALSGTTLTVLDGSVFPAAPFNATVYPIAEFPLSTNAEIVRVTSKVGNALTITRTAEPGGINRAILVGDQILAGPTAKTITDIESAIPSTAGLLSAINVSAGLTSQNLSALTFSNSNGVSFGLNGSVITGTVATNYQSQGAYLTTAALSQDSSKYAGTNGAITGGSITVNTSGVSVNLPAYLTTAMASNRGSDFVQASANFFGTNASATIASNAISISVGAGGQTNQTVGLYASSNTYLTSSGTVDARSLTFRGDKSITVGVSNGEVAFSVGAYLTTAMASNRGSDFVQATAAFHGTNASGTIASNDISVSVAAQTVQTQNMVAVSLSGNTAGVLALVSSGTAIIAGGNNITVSQNGQSITISGANVGGAQTGISGVVVSDATYTSGTISFSNQANVTIGSSVNGATQYVRLSVAAPVPIGTNVKAVASIASTGTITRYAPEDHQHVGVAAFAVTNTGNTLGNTRSQVGTFYIAASGAITASQSTAAAGNDTVWLSVAAQSNQSAIKAFGVSNTGQTAGNTGVSTGIDWVLAGSNSITLSQSTAAGGPNTVWVQHPAWITTATQSSMTVSDAATSGTLARLAFTNLNGVTLSLSSGAGGSHTIVGSHNALTSQSTQYLALTLGGNTSGTTTFHASNNATLFLHGGNNITLSGNGSSVTISGANAGGVQTGISGIVVSDTTYTSGTVSFSNAGNITISSSVNGATQYIRLSGNAAQTNQSAIKGFGVSNTGQTAGNTGISTGIDWVLAGSNSITLSQSTAGGGPNTVWIQHPAWITTATQSSMSVSDNATSGTLARLAFTNLNGVTLSLSTGAGGSHTIIGSHNAITSQSTQFLAMTLGGNTAGTTTFHATNNASLFLNGGNNITLSGNGSTVTISAAAQTNQSAIKAFGVSNTGNTAGNTGISTGVDWVIAGSGNITASESTAVGGPNTVWLSVPTAANGLAAVYDGANSISSGTIRFTNANGVSFSINGQTLSASVAAQTNQTLGLYMSSNTTSSVSSGTVDARSLTFRGMGIASVGYSGGEVVVSVPSGGGGITAVNVSAGTTSNNLSAITFADSNGISFGINASTITASANTVGTATTHYDVASANSVGTVTRWAAEDHRHGGIGAVGISTSGNTAGTTGSVQGTYWFQGGNNLTVSQITSNNGSHTLVLSAGGGAVPSIATTVYDVDSAVSVGTVTRYAAEDHKHAGIGGFGISTAGNSAGTSGSNHGTYWLQGGNAITLSQITSNNGSHTVVISGPGHATVSAWPDVLPGSTAVSTYYSASTSQGAGGGSTRTGYTFSLYAVPFPLPVALAFSELRIGLSNQSVAGTGSATHMFSVGFYSNNASTLSLVSGFYGGIVLSQNSQTAQTFSVFTASTAGATSGNGGGMAGISKASVYSSQGNISANSQIFGRLQFIRVDSGAVGTLTAGQYYVVFGNATASSGANVLSNVGILQSNAILSQAIPDIGRENSTQTSNYLPAWGAISTTFSSNSNAAQFFPLPNAIAISDMSMSSSAWQRFHFPVLRNHS